MITKAYLEGKLSQLEEKMKRIIDIKDERQTEKINSEIKELRKAVKLIEERVEENRDILENYLKERNNLEKEPEKLKGESEELKEPAGNFKEVGIAKDVEKKDDDSAAIISDI